MVFLEKPNVMHYDKIEMERFQRRYFLNRVIARMTGFNAAQKESAFPVIKMEAMDANVRMAIPENHAVS